MRRSASVKRANSRHSADRQGWHSWCSVRMCEHYEYAQSQTAFLAAMSPIRPIRLLYRRTCTSKVRNVPPFYGALTGAVGDGWVRVLAAAAGELDLVRSGGCMQAEKRGKGSSSTQWLWTENLKRKRSTRAHKRWTRDCSSCQSKPANHLPEP